MARPLSQEEFDQLAKQYPGLRTSVLRVHGGRASEHGELYSKETLELVTNEGPQTIELVRTFSCDFGHALGPGNEFAAICTRCGRWLCARADCHYTTDRGDVVCRRHKVIVGEKVLSTREVPGYVVRLVITAPFLLFRALLDAAEPPSRDRRHDRS